MNFKNSNSDFYLKHAFQLALGICIRTARHLAAAIKERTRGDALNDHAAGTESSSTFSLLPCFRYIRWGSWLDSEDEPGHKQTPHSQQSRFVSDTHPPQIIKHNQQQYLAICLQIKEKPRSHLAQTHTLQWSVADAGWKTEQLLCLERLSAHSSRLRSHYVCSWQFLPWLHHPGMETMAWSQLQWTLRLLSPGEKCWVLQGYNKVNPSKGEGTGEGEGLWRNDPKLQTPCLWRESESHKSELGQ